MIPSGLGIRGLDLYQVTARMFGGTGSGSAKNSAVTAMATMNEPTARIQPPITLSRASVVLLQVSPIMAPPFKLVASRIAMYLIR